MKPNPETFTIFGVLWIAFILGGAGLFFLSRNAALKRRVFPYYMAVAGVVFLGFAVLNSPDPSFLYVAVPIVTLIVFINVRAIRFCDACGRTVRGGTFSPAKFCPKCGAPLKP